MDVFSLLWSWVKSSDGVAVGYFIVPIISIIVTTLYTVITFALWRTTVSNQRQLTRLQTLTLRRTDFYAYRRTWNGPPMIAARIQADGVIEQLARAPDNPRAWLSDNPKGVEWKDIALVAHFLGDIAVELAGKQLTEKEVQLGFPEFAHWAPALASVYGRLEREERLVQQLQTLAALFRDAKEER